MPIRPYLPGDEEAQARIFNAAAGLLPAFKPATVDEISRRYRTIDPDPTSKFYALDGDAVVGYAVFSPNGRVSFPWCLPGSLAFQEPLLEEVLKGLKQRGAREAWAAYRADWQPVLAFLKDHGFTQVREMVNYIAELDRLPDTALPGEFSLDPMRPEALPELQQLGKGIFLDDDLEPLRRFFWQNSFFTSDSLYALKDRANKFLGAGLVIGKKGFADPTKLDSAMPCFRLGALGTERDRHKRVNGMFSCVFEDEMAGEILLAEAARRLRVEGLTHVAAQAASDAPALCDFYDRYFQRQGAFPILSRSLR
jgi:hypothetical protein